MTRTVLLLAIVLSAPIKTARAQSLSLVGRGNLSIGLQYNDLDYNGGELFYSPGGGMGLEGGLRLDIGEGFAIQSTLGYQLHLALQTESINGISNKSSFNFNRKFVSFGMLKKFKLGHGIVGGFQLGAGTSLNLPGTLKRIENDNELGESNYNSNVGFYFEAGLRLRILDNVYLDPAIRYRQLSFVAKSFSDGAISDLPEHLQQLNANGIELGLTIVKNIGSDQL